MSALPKIQTLARYSVQRKRRSCLAMSTCIVRLCGTSNDSINQRRAKRKAERVPQVSRNGQGRKRRRNANVRWTTERD